MHTNGVRCTGDVGPPAAVEWRIPADKNGVVRAYVHTGVSAGGGRLLVRLDSVGEAHHRLDAHGHAVLVFAVGLLKVDLGRVKGHGGTELPDISRPVEMMVMMVILVIIVNVNIIKSDVHRSGY